MRCREAAGPKLMGPSKRGEENRSLPAEKASESWPKIGGGGAAVSTWYNHEMGKGQRETRSSVNGQMKTPSPGWREVHGL